MKQNFLCVLPSCNNVYFCVPHHAHSVTTLYCFNLYYNALISEPLYVVSIQLIMCVPKHANFWLTNREHKNTCFNNLIWTSMINDFVLIGSSMMKKNG